MEVWNNVDIIRPKHTTIAKIKKTKNDNVIALKII